MNGNIKAPESTPKRVQRVYEFRAVVRIERDELDLNPSIARQQIIDEYRNYSLPQYVISEFVDTIISRESKFQQYAKNPLSSAKGILQWLDSSYLGYGCIGNATVWRAAVNCSIKAYQRNGLNDWKVTEQSITGKL